MNPANFLAELRRRNVYRAAVAYGMVAWFLTQLTTQVFPLFEIPNGAIRLVVVALALGFPIAMCLSWLYEFTPEGIVRSEDLSPTEVRSARRATGRILDFIIIGVLLLVIAMLIYQRFPFRTESGETLAQKSIAVLPFENLSAEKEDAFFADGIQDDVLTSLGKIRELTVIARPSVMAYRGAAVSGKLREIGKTLGVAHVLAGSVRRSADRVVVTVQLIDTRDSHQLWSERYERTLSDALSLQGELAIEIARQLRATLTPTEKRLVATKPTENPDAYVLYLRARELELRLAPSRQDYEAALKLYQQAVDLDPKFALARARLSMRLTGLAVGLPEKYGGVIQNAREEAEEALRTQPNLGEARLALAEYYFSGLGELDRGLGELSHAEELMPNSAEVWTIRAVIYKRQNKFRERIAALQHAEILDPRDRSNLVLLWFTQRAVRNWPEAVRISDRINALLPPDSVPPAFWEFAYCKFRMSGVIEPLKMEIATAPAGSNPGALSRARYELAMLERDYPAAERYLRETPAEVFSRSALGDGFSSKSMHEALLTVARGAEPAVVESALVVARQEIEKSLAGTPDDAVFTARLGLIDAFAGRKEDAIREGRRALEVANRVHDSVSEKNDVAATLALIYARTGESDEAIKLIEKLLTAPANLDNGYFDITQADLKWGWVWDPLRDDPRFQKILERPEPKTIY